MNETERKTKVTLEDLLQIKRAERPPVEFWTQFEQELRAKQLAALVDNRPWWRSLTTRKLLIRIYAPLGAAAVVAVTFGSFHGGVRSRTNANELVALQAPAVSVESSATQQSDEARQLQAETFASADLSSQPGVSNSSSNENAQPIYSGSASDSAEQILASSTATVKAAGQALAQLVGLGDNQPIKMDTVRTAMVEPLSQLATPRDNRRTRLLAYSVAYDPHAADSTDAARSRERITRRISDESIYDSISRLGVSGDRVSIKF